MRNLNGSRGLIILNMALLMVLAAVTLAPESGAQQRGGGGGIGTNPGAGVGRARGDYTMVSGRVTGGSSNAVYVVDANNQELLSLLWNQSGRGLDVIGYRDLHADATAQPGR
jgi:hypothetical protein